VRFTDTLPGIAFKYGVTVREIKEANKMTHDMIYGYTQLLIPRKPHHKSSLPSYEPENEENLKKQLVNRFRRTQLVSEEEARYYLELADWRYDRAVNERKEDLEFERKVPFRPAKRVL
jgi:LysM repeat protein